MTYQLARRQYRGTAMVMVLVISTILTGLVLTVAWAAGIQSQMAGAGTKLDQAQMAAESAGQLAVWQFKKDNTWRQSAAPSTLPTITIGGQTYTYALTCVDAGAAATLYWPMSEGTGTTTADTSGHNNTGTLYGGVSWTTGKFGNGLAFNGSSGYVDAGSDPSTNIVSSMTMAAWVKMNSAAQDQKVGGNQDGYSGGYKMSIYGLKVEFEVRDASNNPTLNRFISGGTIIPTGVWYHVAGVYNTSDGTIKTYVNGVLDRTLTGVGSTALSSTTGSFKMGREPWINGANTRWFNGAMDDVRVYNRALSATEISTLANTSVHIHAGAQLQTTSSNAPMAAVDFICSAPTPLPPVAPALTVGGACPMKYLTVSGDVQVGGAISPAGSSSVNGKVTYGTTYTDPNHYLTVTYKGAASAPTLNASATVPTIDYTTIKGLAANTTTGGSNQTFQFNYVNDTANVWLINGNCTDPVIDTTTNVTTGTVIITGNLTLTKSATWGAAGVPANVIVQGNVSQTGGTLTMTGCLYVGGNWTHKDCTIYGDVCVGGSVTDNSVSGSTIVVSSIPWFDPRAGAGAVAQSLFYATYQGTAP